MDSKQIMAQNIRRLMEEKGVNSKEVIEALGFKQPTFSDWINAKMYPRVDKINKMAEYFGVETYELTEPHSKIDKLNRIRESMDKLEELKVQLRKREDELKILYEETQAIQDELLKMDSKKRDHLLAYMRLLNNEG
jgi:transcriptional regulator with XRE-family HTH domain